MDTICWAPNVVTGLRTVHELPLGSSPRHTTKDYYKLLEYFFFYFASVGDGELMVIRQLTLTTNDGRLTTNDWRLTRRQDETTEYIIVKAYNGDKTSKCVPTGTEDGAAACTQESKTAQQHVPRLSSMYNKETQKQPHVRQRATRATACTTKRHKRSHMYNNTH